MKTKKTRKEGATRKKASRVNAQFYHIPCIFCLKSSDIRKILVEITIKLRVATKIPDKLFTRLHQLSFSTVQGIKMEIK